MSCPICGQNKPANYDCNSDYHDTTAELREEIVDRESKVAELLSTLRTLVVASEVAMDCIHRELGYSVLKASFGELMDAVDVAKMRVAQHG